MLPIALGIGAGAEVRAPMAVSVVGGLVTSTLLTLVVVPVLLDLVGQLIDKVKGSLHLRTSMTDTVRQRKLRMYRRNRALPRQTHLYLGEQKKRKLS